MTDQKQQIENASEIYQYVDDTKMYRRTRNQTDCLKLQKDVDAFRRWSEEWLLLFHPKKCKYMRIGMTNIGSSAYRMAEQMAEVSSEKYTV